jgi:hypothetical protein
MGQRFIDRFPLGHRSDVEFQMVVGDRGNRFVRRAVVLRRWRQWRDDGFAEGRDSVIAGNRLFNCEGVAVCACGTQVPESSPAHRFCNGQTGWHFYTMSGAEKDCPVRNDPSCALEGTAYYALTTQ